jgi:hypothetical protein
LCANPISKRLPAQLRRMGYRLRECTEFGRSLAPAGALADGARALVVDLDREGRGSAYGRRQVLSRLPGSLKVGPSCHRQHRPTGSTGATEQGGRVGGHR